jgi:uncharacterized protein (DUF2249 family)
MVLATRIVNKAMMPLQPCLVDLRRYPSPQRKKQLHASLEEMAKGETLLVVNDCDSELLLDQLNDVLEEGFSCWVTEEGPEVWRILISRSNH